MSRQIDYDKPLSDDDRQYLKDRGQGHVIKWMDEQFGNGKSDGEDSDEQVQQNQGDESTDTSSSGYGGEHSGYDPDDVAYVETLTVEELKGDLGKAGLSTSGLKADLQKRLLDHLAKQDS